MITKTRCHRYCWAAVSTAPRAVLMITASVLLLLIAAPIAIVTFAGNTVGSFEIDGNLAVDHAVPPLEPIDWESTPTRVPRAVRSCSDTRRSMDPLTPSASMLTRTAFSTRRCADWC